MYDSVQGLPRSVHRRTGPTGRNTCLAAYVLDLYPFGRYFA